MATVCRQLVLLTTLLACACSEPRATSKADGREESAAGIVRVVFSLPGDDIGSPESVALLERLKDSVAARGVGEVLGSGFGMGRMDLVVRLQGENPRSALEAIVRAEFPAARYRIERVGP